MKNKDVNLHAMRVFGLVIGSKRIGLAIWNPGARMARSLDILHRKTLAKDLETISQIVINERVEAFLVGLPLSLSGKITESTQNAQYWAELLREKFSLPVLTHDEAMTTQLAEEKLRHRGPKAVKEKKDAVAAALLLEDFFGVS